MTTDVRRATVLAAAIIGILAVLALGWRSCAQRGGTYVRGVVWMACVR